MLELSLSRLGGIAGGCYCYCFKYPFSYKNMVNPTTLIGEREDASICEAECYREESRVLGYFAYSGCIDYIKTEGKPTQSFLEGAEWLDRMKVEFGNTGSS